MAIRLGAARLEPTRHRLVLAPAKDRRACGLDQRKPALRRHPAVPPSDAGQPRRSTKARVETLATRSSVLVAIQAADRRSTKARIETPATLPLTAKCGQIKGNRVPIQLSDCREDHHNASCWPCSGVGCRSRRRCRWISAHRASDNRRSACSRRLE